MTEVFLYNIEKDKALKIKNLCRQLYIGVREIDRSQFGVKLSALLGLSDDSTAQEPSDFEAEMLYLVGFSAPLLNSFLNRLRRQKTPVALKAMMTETNLGFTSYQLYRELQAEHEALSQQEEQ